MRHDMTTPQITRLAKSLAHAARIPEGNDLVWVLGCGTEHDNLEALITWIRQTLSDPDLDLATQVLPTLVDRLGTELLRYEWRSS